jgi:hypothetical protein
MSWTIAATATALTLVSPARALAASPTPEEACRAAKNRAAGKYAACRQTAEAKLALNADVLKYTDAVAKCGTKFSAAWQKAIDKATLAGATCLDDALTLGDFQGIINAHSDVIARGLSGMALQSPQSCVAATRLRTGQETCYGTTNAGGVIGCGGTGQDGELLRGIARRLSYVDNGDGTIIDNMTGLMWEKLTRDGSIHDRDNQYTWSGAFAKVAGLNTAAFAGHTDWRLPNVNELQTLANYGALTPSVDLEFNTSCNPSCDATTCSCTRTSFYWSSTTYLPMATLAWGVTFDFGRVDQDLKTLSNYARAVRDVCVAATRPLQTGQTTCYDPSGMTDSTVTCDGTTGQDGDLKTGVARSYLDNGDGTITDNATGLVWEKLNNDNVSIHDRDNTYTLADAYGKIAMLNASSFAGHNDWRLPNINELQSLADYGATTTNQAIAAAFNGNCASPCSTCSCNKSAAFYWSSTSYQLITGSAWGIFFGVGDAHTGTKEAVDWVRAVRGGCSS